MAEVVRWGIVGAGGIARRFATSLESVPGAELKAAWSRSPEKLRAFAAEFGCDEATSSQELIASSAIDALYVALPHGLHAATSIAALKAGKAVLCEKPATLSAAQAQQVAATARETGSLFVEAMKPRFQPLWKTVLELVDGGSLGRLTAIEARLAMIYPQDRQGYVVDPLEGGMLLDLGTYEASWIEAFTTGAPAHIHCHHLWRGPVDWMSDCRFTQDEVACQLFCSAQENESRVRLSFERATLEAEPLHRPTALTVCWEDGRVEELTQPYEGDDFTGEIEHVTELVREGAKESPVMPLSATMGCARIIDACRSGFDRLAVAERLSRALGPAAVRLDEPMSAHTSFEVGGPADIYVEPATTHELLNALDELAEVPALLVGKGSDLLVSDAGFRGCVVSTEQLLELEVDGQRIRASAGVGLKELCERACAAGLGGLEFASGIPGSVGGAVYMNAGAYDGCVADVVESVRVRYPDGSLGELSNGELAFGYRQSRVRSEGLLVLEATFLLQPSEPAAIRARMEELWERRVAKQPLDYPSAGSTFKRPPGHFAGKLIADAGLKGYRVGGAEVSPKHAGFVVNVGDATATDVYRVIEHVRRTVEERFGVTLEPEVQLIGRF